jgi:hypothetical protein
MIRITLIMLLGLMVSCHTPKKVVEEQQTKVEPEKETPPQEIPDAVYYYLGVIDMTKSCGPTIEISNGTTKKSYYPINLDPKFQINGMRVKLTYRKLSEDRVAIGCKEFEAIEINEIFAVR